MKRSVIYLALLIALIAAGVGAESVYTARLSENVLEILDVCESSGKSERAELCEQLRSMITEKENINRLFFTKDILEKINIAITDMEVYASYGDSAEFISSAERVRIYIEHINFNLF